METVLTNKYKVSEEDFKKIMLKTAEPYIDSFYEKIEQLIKQIEYMCDNKGIIYLDESEFPIYINTELKAIMPKLQQYRAQRTKDFNSIDGLLKNKKIYKTLPAELPLLSHLKQMRSEFVNKYSGDFAFVCIDDKSKERAIYIPFYTYSNNDKVCIGEHSIEKFLSGKEYMIYIIPTVELHYSTARELLMKYIIPYGFSLKDFPQSLQEGLYDLITLSQHNPQGKTINVSDKRIFSEEVKAVIEKNIKDGDWVKSLHWQLFSVLRQYYDKKCLEEDTDNLKTQLLNCEKVRADIDPYEERILTDPNRGHWDLWMDQEDLPFTVEVEDELVARNPVCDINENGVIAIDFGTKSTIVVYQSDIEHSLPMGIGDGNLSKENKETLGKRYENPTVMHFVDLDSFLKAYKEKKGRPKTEWEDLTISHTAMDQFANSRSSEYYEYMHQIKQWAGQREKQFRIQSHDGKTYVLPAFLDLKEDDWNPIEIYAYYIGLYINNMRKGHGIFLDYYLSFPVTYETKIREKIVKSFEKGLKKSLPTTVLNNEELMKRFHVNGDISEPAAYAVCALQEYGFEPEEDEEIFYGIFDFGGGTTDFDFGLWKESSKRRYDYTIENFGAGGDEYLGGENLLEMLAFEVFKENQTLMRSKGYTFTLAPKCTEFIGSDALLADSQEAEKNMHNLMEAIRPYWERKSDEAKKVSKTYNSTIDKKVEEILKSIKNDVRIDEIVDELNQIVNDYNSFFTENASEIMESLSVLIEHYGIQVEKGKEDKIKFVVTLFDKEGEDHVNETLYFDQNKLDQLIEDRIREGVNNFFSALMLSYQSNKAKKNETINILLAGNSCKSPVVRKVFDEAIAEKEQEIKKKYNREDVENLFEVFPPLGTEEAYQKMEERGILVEKNNPEKPTGKTGVAFGLIQCRAGGVIERITHNSSAEEIPFQYFIGWRSKKKFVIFEDEAKITKYRGKPDYNEWYKFIEADDSIFDLYYTTLPECVSGNLLVDGNAAVKRLRCEIDVVDESAYVYIRAVNPHTLEYVVAKNDDVENTKLGKVVRKEL